MRPWVRLVRGAWANGEEAWATRVDPGWQVRAAIPVRRVRPVRGKPAGGRLLGLRRNEIGARACPERGLANP